MFNWDLFWRVPQSERLVRKKNERQHTGQAKTFETTGHFQHCLLANRFFLCPVEGHEGNFQAASAQATENIIMCVCVCVEQSSTAGERARKEGEAIHQNVFCDT